MSEASKTSIDPTRLRRSVGAAVTAPSCPAAGAAGIGHCFTHNSALAELFDNATSGIDIGPEMPVADPESFTALEDLLRAFLRRAH
jgi:hypothetical protein